MKKSHIFFGLSFLSLGYWGSHLYDVNSACYEIVQVGKPLHGEMLLDKCKGRTWTLVQDTGTPSEILGYVAEEKEEELKTLVWTRVYRGGGMLSFGDTDK